MILLFTDFGIAGPYVGQMHLVLRRLAPEVPIVDLQHDAPAFRPDLASYLLASHLALCEPGDVVVAVVDPGVGSARTPLALRLDGTWLVGPDNGLFEIALRRAQKVESYRIIWRPQRLSATFHGRDLFAPIAARLARGDCAGLEPAPVTRYPDWSDDRRAIVYLDPYGNAMTGVRASAVPPDAPVRVKGVMLVRARTFADVPAGSCFAFENSSGLLEIAANGASAATLLGLRLGDPVEILGPDC